MMIHRFSRANTRIFSAVWVFCLVAGLVHANTPFPVDDATRRGNVAKVNAQQEGAYWRNSGVAVCTVEAMSGTRRTPDLFPEDGKFTMPLRFIGARGEYEPASFMLFADKDMAEVSLTASDLTAEGGAKIPADAIDLTVVKVWYQMGTAWYGFHADHTRRVAVPELMLHDETLVRVDYANQENFVRCDYPDGTRDYQWISFMPAHVNHTGALWAWGSDPQWIRDAETLRPFRLQQHAFKQFMATLKIPGEAQAGLYKGGIAVVAGGQTLFSIPVETRVLPFELPRPATMRDLDRPFMASVFLGASYHKTYNPADSLNVAKSLAAHNLLNPLLGHPSGDDPGYYKRLAANMQAAGLDTGMLFSALPSGGITTSYPPKETDKDYDRYVDRARTMTNAIGQIRQEFGDDSIAFAYGIDEAGPATVRAQRATWRMVHALGGRMMVATRMRAFLLFNLDFALMPLQPTPVRKLDADALHDSNPDALVGWYADPHSGPENPDFARRVYGWQTWRNNYDMFGQYILMRRTWNDFWYPHEAMLRGLMLCYPKADDDIVDTLAYEGVREAVDDIRYGTLLRQLATRAMKEAKDVDTQYRGRAAMTWVAQVDFYRSSLESLRYEMIDRILDLQERLAKEGK